MRMFRTRKQLLAFFMPGFLLGIIYVNFIAKRYLAEPGIFSAGILEQFRTVHISAGDYLWYLLRVRAVPFGILAALGFTKMRKPSVVLVLLWTGLSGGILISSAILSMGIKGSIFCLVGLMPQFLMYIPACLVLIWYSWSYPQNRWNRQKTVFVVLMVSMGMIMEIYINPILVRWLIAVL